MKKSILIFAIAFFANFAGNAQSDSVIYLKFTSTDVLIDGKVHKNVCPMTELCEENAIGFGISGNSNGYYHLSFVHIRFKRSEVIKIREFFDTDFMEATRIPKEMIDEQIIDLDSMIVNWTKEDAWEFAAELKNWEKKIFFIDTRDTEDGVYLARRVILTANSAPKMMTMTKEQYKKMLRENKDLAKAFQRTGETTSCSQGGGQ